MSGEPAAQKTFWLATVAKPLFFLLALLTAGGIYVSSSVPISVFPDTNFPRIVIGADNGVMPVEQMQVLVTRIIEDSVNSVPGLVTVRSTTSRGTAEVSLFFDWDVDMFRTLQLTDAALAKVRQELPATAKITTNRLTFATFPIVGYALTADDRGSDTVSQGSLWQIATYQLKPPINRVPGVSTVVVQGGQVPEFHIVPDPAKLQAAGLTATDLVNAVQASNIIESPGLYEANHQLILGLVGAQAHDAASLGQLTLKATSAGVAVRLADVAAVGPASLPVYTRVAANGRAAVLLNITRQPSSNTVNVATAVDAEINRLRAELPPGVRLTSFYDQSELVRSSIASVRDAILIGLLLACIVLFLFLGDWSSTLIAGLVLPVTVAVTILFLWAIGQSFNLMTLGGLAAATGLVIDDAIVVIENIVVHRDQGQDRFKAVQSALREMLAPLIGSTLTPVVVFLPLIVVSGVTGSFFRALALTLTAALLTSLVLALTLTPALSLWLLRAGKHQRTVEPSTEDSPLLGRFLVLHRRILTWSIERKFMVACIAALLLIATYFTYGALDSNLLPAMDEGAFVLDYVMPAGSSLDETTCVLDRVDRILLATPEVSITTRRTGLQLGLAAVTEANTGDISVRLKPNASRPIEDVIAEVRQKIHEQAPELDVEFVQVLEDMINDLSNSPEPIQIKLFSSDADLLHSIAPKVQAAIARLPGIVDTQNGVDNTLSGPATNFAINPALASRLGFTPQEIADDVTTVLDGLPINAPMIVNGRPYTIRVRMSEQHRQSLDAIANTVFNSASGHTATLGALATITELPPQHEIRRENLVRVTQVSGRLEGSDLGGAMQRVKTAVADLHLPPTVRVAFGGTYAEQQRSFADLARVLMLALALVFFVLLAEFRNFSAPIAILTSSILPVAGVVFALFITHTDFNIASFMGLIMVIGIVAKNGILLLDAEQRARAAGVPAREAMFASVERRLRPILMTATAAICGMLPLALGIGSGSQMLQPLAIAVIGGLLLSIALSLVVTPLLYYHLASHRPA